MRTESLISAGLLKSGLKRFWPLWVVYLVALFMVLVAPAYSATFNFAAATDSPESLADAMQTVWGLMKGATLACMFVAAGIVAVSLNDHLFDARAATFVGSLPLRRRTVFATTYATGLIAQVAVLLVVFVVLIGMHFMLPSFQVSMAGMWLGLSLALTFVFYSLATLVCQLTGNRPVAVVLYVVVNILAMCIEAAIHLVVSAFLYGLADWSLLVDWLSPAVGIAHYGIYGAAPLSFEISWPVIVGYCGAAIVFVAVSGVLFAHRDFEMAGEAVAWSKLRPVLKYLAGISGALLFAAITVLLYWSDGVSGLGVGTAQAIQLVVLMVVGGALGVVLSEMTMSRTTHVFKRCAKGCAVLACVTIAFAAVVCTDALGIASRIPATSEVEQVAVRVDGMDAGTFASEQGVDQVRQLQGDILEYGGAKGLEENYVQSDISLMYTLNNGQVLQRRYPVFYNGEDYFERAMDDRGRDLIDEVSAIANGEEGRESRFGKYFGDEAGGCKVTLRYYADSEDYSLVTLSAKDAKDFLQNALKPDVMHHSGGEFWVYANERNDEYDAWVELVGEDGYMPLNIWLGDQSTPSSVKWFKEHYSNIKLVHVAEGEAPLG